MSRCAQTRNCISRVVSVSFLPSNNKGNLCALLYISKVQMCLYSVLITVIRGTANLIPRIVLGAYTSYICVQRQIDFLMGSRDFQFWTWPSDTCPLRHWSSSIYFFIFLFFSDDIFHVETRVSFARRVSHSRRIPAPNGPCLELYISAVGI